ncbi:MAG TPA: M12 family metallo-peptidase, partial [Thermoanaerobaculia bacterium]
MTSSRSLFWRLVGIVSVPGAASLLFWFGPLAASAAQAAAPPIVRAIDDSSLFVPPGGNALEEVVTLNREVPLTLLRAPLGARIQFADWPVAPGVRRTVTLERHDIYAADAKIVKIVPEGIVEVPRSRWLFYWGDDAEGASRIVVSVDPDDATLHAMSMSDEGASELTLQPGGASPRYRLADPTASTPGGVPPAWTCGAEALPPEPPSHPGERPLWIGQESLNPQSVESVNKSAVVAIDTDNEYMLNRFANNTTNAVNWIASLIANTNVIYERDVSLHLFQGYTILRLSTTADPYVTGASGNADGTKLSDFGNYWSTHYGSIKRTVAAMLSGKQPGGGASGIAWISGLCSSSVGYSFNQLFTSAYLFGDTLIFGHEVGHNFGSPHTHCYSPPADNCYNGEAGCYPGPTSCPATLNINGYSATGTLMSYCHLSPCNSTTTLAFHPRTLTEYFNARITTAISNGCIFNVGGSLPAGPTVSNISPPNGTTAGGTSVTITGTNFSLRPKPTVSFADLSGSVSLTVGAVTSTSITATTPAHAAGVMDVVVMNSDYQTATFAGGFTYTSVVSPPTVTAVTP